MTALQKKEEKLESKSYEIWLDSATGAHHTVGFPGVLISEYQVCPKCHGQTLEEPHLEVRKKATRTQDGVGEHIQKCAFCDYSVSLGIVALERIGSSSSSSHSSGGGSSGGSSGSSFGGGSSGGGGAGGRW